jgi:hypothetical protein
MTLENLVSKLLAGGLSAGMVLLWWPSHLPTSGLEWLVLRGVLGTLVFELLLLAFAPAERRARAAVLPQRANGRFHERFAPRSPGARTGGAVALAFAGLAAPVVLLAGAHGAPPTATTPAAQRVVERVVVEKPVVRRVVVRKVVTMPAVTVPSAPASAPAAVDEPSRTTRKSATSRDSKRSSSDEETNPKSDETPSTGSTAPSTSSEPTATTPTTTTTTPTTTAPATGDTGAQGNPSATNPAGGGQ